MSFVKKLAGETVIYGMGSILPRILYYLFITTYITYKFPDTYNYGIYNDLYAYSSVILVLFLFRMDTAFFRFGSRNNDQIQTFGAAIIPVLFISFLGVILLLFFSEQIASFLKYEGGGYYVRWFAFILGFDAIAGMFYAKFRLQSRPLKFLFFKIANVLITLGVVFFFLEIEPRLFTQPLIAVKRSIDYVFIANLVGSIVVLVFMIPDILRVRWKWDPQLLKRMFWYAGPLVLVGIAGQINQTFAIPLQKFFLGNGFDENLTKAGAYAGPMKIALLLNLFTVAFNYAAEPFFFNNVKNENADKAYGQIMHAFVLACGVAMMSIVSFQEIAILLIGESYRGPQDIIPILLFSNLFLGIYYNISIWYKLSDRTIYGAYISIGGALITLSMSVFLLPVYGYIISAYASLFCYGFMMVMGYLLGQKLYPINYPVRKVVTIIFTYFVFIQGTIYLKSLVASDSMALMIGGGMFLAFLLFQYIREKKTFYEYLKP